MSQPDQVAGQNTRYAPERFKGYTGAKSANQCPFQNQQTFNISGSAGTYDGSVVVPAAATNFQVQVNVTTPFDGSATLIVGIPGNTNLFVNLSDAVPLNAVTAAPLAVVREVSYPSAQAPRATVGGSPTVGAGTVTVSWEV